MHQTQRVKGMGLGMFCG